MAKLQVARSVDQIKKKFENCKTNARKRKLYLTKMKQTGGGKLTNQEKRIAESDAYEDLALKMGESAIGSMPRNDSDAGSSTAVANTLQSSQNFMDIGEISNHRRIQS